MNTREAIIISCATGNPIMDVDPINLLVVDGDHALFNDPLADAMRALFLVNHELTASSLVWSDTRTPVMVECDTCLRVVDTNTSTAFDGDVEAEEGDAIMCVDCLA